MNKMLLCFIAAVTLLIGCETTPDPPQKDRVVTKRRPYPDTSALGKPRPERAQR